MEATAVDSISHGRMFALDMYRTVLRRIAAYGHTDAMYTWYSTVVANPDIRAQASRVNTGGGIPELQMVHDM